MQNGLGRKFCISHSCNGRLPYYPTNDDALRDQAHLEYLYKDLTLEWKMSIKVEHGACRQALNIFKRYLQRISTFIFPGDSSSSYDITSLDSVILTFMQQHEGAETLPFEMDARQCAWFVNYCFDMHDPDVKADRVARAKDHMNLSGGGGPEVSFRSSLHTPNP